MTAAWSMDSDEPEVDGLLISVLFVVDGVINSLCAYLLFSYAKAEYQCLCRCCDQCLSRCCASLVQKCIARSQIHEFESMHAQQMQKSQQMKNLSPRLINAKDEEQVSAETVVRVAGRPEVNV